MDARNQSPELLADLADKVAASLTQLLDTPKEVAEHIGYEVASQMAEDWGGLNLYFPKGMMRLAHARDLAIYQEFNGTNHAALVKKYGCSLQWIYRIVKKMRKADLEGRQGSLPI